MIATQNVNRRKAPDKITLYEVEGGPLARRAEDCERSGTVDAVEFDVCPLSKLVADNFQDNLEADLERCEHIDYEWLDGVTESEFKAELRAVVDKYFNGLVLSNGKIVK